MGVASTVSRLPITVKVVPVSSNAEEGGREQQQQGEPEEEGPQQQNSQTQAEEEAAQTGNICLIHHTDTSKSSCTDCKLYWWYCDYNVSTTAIELGVCSFHSIHYTKWQMQPMPT